MKRNDSRWARHWLLPSLLLVLLPSLGFWLLYALDHRLAGGEGAMFTRYLNLDPEHLTDAISQLAPVVAALLGIVVTVVAIIVQLAAGRYPGVTGRFVRDRVNRLILGYFVGLCLIGLWLSLGLQGDFVPRVTLLAVLAMTALGLGLVLPYFAHVFRFLEPVNLVERIGREADALLARASAAEPDPDAAQAQAVERLVELGDIARAAIQSRDSRVAGAAVDTLARTLIDYQALRPRSTAAWRRIGPRLRRLPDIVALAPESLDELEVSGLWLEWFTLRQQLLICAEALGHVPDIQYLVAIDTRYVGEAAVRRGDQALLRLVLRFLNSYLRQSLNHRNVRAAYNILNQYRLLLTTSLEHDAEALVLQGAAHMGYYGQLAQELGLGFVTETVAHDTAQLCQAAHAAGKDCERPLLAHFLELDRPAPLRSDETLIGVRKAQAKLAAYYLEAGAEDRARLIAADMADEPASRLQRVRHALEAEGSAEFWEISDRGHRFEYMPERQRARLAEFFTLIEQSAAQRR